MRTFEDPLEDLHDNVQNSCEDLQGSFIFLPRSLWIFHFPVKTLEDLVQIFKDLDKNSEDPLKIFENSLRIFQILVQISPRSSRIFHFPTKILNNLVVNLQRSC